MLQIDVATILYYESMLIVQFVLFYFMFGTEQKKGYNLQISYVIMVIDHVVHYVSRSSTFQSRRFEAFQSTFLSSRFQSSCCWQVRSGSGAVCYEISGRSLLQSKIFSYIGKIFCFEIVVNSDVGNIVRKTYCYSQKFRTKTLNFSYATFRDCFEKL